ncbi:AsnC family transcriptional regulator [Actinosynnema sp. NPDC020468]|uniref:Lrp/AsnC family transcriptional regulator n=1 Tax=Actinosynnema sp. NPDC020468 TaxID=3154488 RepID=UPI0033FD57CF
MLDTLDRALIHALQVDGRAPFARVAAALDVSTQTITRRHQRLTAEAGLRVVGLTHHHAAQRWVTRITAAPSTARDLAESLARRTDTSWVKLTSGGTEIIAFVHATTSLLLDDIPKTTSITAVSAHLVLNVHLGGPTAWSGRVNSLTPQQIRALTPEQSDPDDVRDTDAPLLHALARNGRTPLGELASATGHSPATVAKRLRALRSSDALYFDVEIDARLLGADTQALLWISTAPKDQERTAKALARHGELAFVAATTGPTNLVAQALCTDPADLHRYLTRSLAAVDGITALETSPVLRTLKAAGPVSPDRGASPTRPAARRSRTAARPGRA